MLIKKEDAQQFQNATECTVWEYSFPSKNLSLAISKIHGSYPLQGKMMNQKCDLIY